MTTACNYKCDFCHVITGLNQKQERLSQEEWIKISQSILPFSVVCLSGGEALLASETIPLIKALRKRKVIVTLVTNGSLLSNKKIDELVQSDISYLMISMDGFGSYHDKSRGVHGAFEKIDKALKYIDANYSRKLTLGIKVVVKDDNLEEIKELLSYLNGFKCVGDIAFGLLYDNLPNGALNTFESLDDEILQRGNTYAYDDSAKENVKETIRYIESYKKQTKKELSFTFKTKSLDDLFKYVDDKNLYGVKECFLPWTDFSIQANGKITPCLSYNLGDVREINYNLKKISTLPRVKEFQQYMAKNPFHSACEGCPCATGHEAKPQLA